MRLEGLAFALLAGLAIVKGPGWPVWWETTAVLLAPDLAILAYAAGPRVGAWAYNAVHTYVGPIVMLALGLANAEPGFLQIGALWMIHVGADRALGFGLKSVEGFKVTHLGRMP